MDFKILNPKNKKPFKIKKPKESGKILFYNSFFYVV